MATEAANSVKELVGNLKEESRTKAAGGIKRHLPTLCVCLGLIGLALACFFRTIKDGYFIADDFGAVGYVGKVFEGHWDLFWANWTGNYMKIPSMSVYRPWQIVTLYMDFLMSHGQAFGYYFTNFRYYVGDALLLFFIGRQLTSSWGNVRSLVGSGLAAAMFIVNPLHCETVSWVVGRVDSECAFYYLFGLLFYLQYRKQQKPRWLVLATTFFWLGILVKEMAIGFPVLATTLSFLGINQTDDQATFKQRLVRAFKESAPIWVSTVIYFVIRYLALGTFVGGYTGAIGADQAHSALQRWFDPDCYYRLFFPFSISLYLKENPWAHWLSTCYAVLAAVFAIKLLRREIPGKLSAFLFVWMATTLVPIYKLWGMGMDLEGARFCFFFTGAFAVALALLALAPSSKGERGNSEAGGTPAIPVASRAPASAATAIVASVALVGVVLILYKVCLRTNAQWIHAGKEVKALMQRASSLSQSTPDNAKLIVLGIPKKHGGSHLIYNGVTFRIGLKHPYQPTDNAAKYLTFDPLIWGPDEYINASRLKTCLAMNGAMGPYVWNSGKEDFMNASFPPATGTAPRIALAALVPSPTVQAYADGHATVQFHDGIFTFTKNQSGDGLQFNKLSVDPRQYDFLQFEYRIPAEEVATNLVFQAKWHGSHETTGESEMALAHKLVVPVHTMGTGDARPFQTVRIPLSHFWRWFACGTINDLALILPAVPGIELRNPVLISDADVRPTLKAVGIAEDGSGVFKINAKSQISIDASKIPGAASLVIECSKPQYFFDQIVANDGAEAVYKSAEIKGTRFEGPLPTGLAQKEQFCELRVRAFDAAGHALAEYSDPTMIQLQ